MSAPPLEPDRRPYGTCVCGNSLPDPALSIHRRTCGLHLREEEVMPQSPKPGGGTNNPEPKSQQTMTDAMRAAARGNWNADRNK